jgi:predicted nucleic acid-binding protein
MWKRSSAIANLGIRSRGIDPRSNVVIAAERQGHTVRQILEHFTTVYGEIEIGLSVVTVVELTHGIQRAKLEERRQRRQAFVDELIRDVPVHPVTSKPPSLLAASKASRRNRA